MIKTDFVKTESANLFFFSQEGSRNLELVFIHGSSSSHSTWINQLESEHLKKFAKVVFDLPAHGASSSAMDPNRDYSLPGMARILAQAIDKVCKKGPFVLIGVSLGCNIIAEMLLHGISPAAIVMAGPCVAGRNFPPERIMMPDTKIGVGFTDAPTDNDLDGLMRIVFNRPTPTVERQFKADFMMVKGNYRSALGSSIAAGNYNDQIEALTNSPVPKLILFGKNERAIFPDYLDEAGLNLWKNKVFQIEDAGHWVHIDNPAAFNSLLAAFFDQIDRQL